MKAGIRNASAAPPLPTSLIERYGLMDKTAVATIDLIIANRVLAQIGAVDAYGHASVRHPERPDRFLLSRSRSPELVEEQDIMEFDMRGAVVDKDNRAPYLERFIHAGVYAARPDVHAVMHGHARGLIPFTVTKLKMRPVFMTADEVGRRVPVWDIRTRFGRGTDMLIVNMEQAEDLAQALGPDRVVLMRGHGFIAGGRSASQLIRICRALIDNAAAQLESERFGEIDELTDEEIAARRASLADDDSPGLMRGFEYDALKAGLGELWERRKVLTAKR
jgi:ribulose-5-phosphate 4-epimerase/fuculose-1-phosphate aldolase